MNRLVLKANTVKLIRDGAEKIIENASVFYDDKKDYSLILVYGNWELRGKILEIEGGKNITDSSFKKSMANLLNAEIELKKAQDALYSASNMCRKAEFVVKENMGKICPTGQYLKDTLDCKLPQNISISSWTVSVDRPQSITIQHNNDLGTGNYHLVEFREETGGHLLGDEKTLCNRYCPNITKIPKNTFKYLKIEEGKKEYSIGCKDSVVFSTSYNVNIPKLTTKTVDLVVEEILKLSKMI